MTEDLESNSVSEEYIRPLAYMLWQNRGEPIGSPEVDWFAAEQKIRLQIQKAEVGLSSELDVPH